MSGRPRRKDQASSSRTRAASHARRARPGGGQDTPAAATPHGNAPEPATARVDIAERPARAAGSDAAPLTPILYLVLIVGSIATITRAAAVAFDEGEPAAVAAVALVVDASIWAITSSPSGEPNRS